MAKKLTQKQLSDLRQDYLEKREELLIKKVDTIAIKLFEKVFDNYLTKLEQEDGKLLNSNKNFDVVKGLDEIYNAFVKSDNIPVIKGFVKDLQGITPLNERYFLGLTDKSLESVTKRVASVVDRNLGIDEEGRVKKNGFTDKFIRDKMVLKAIKKITNKAITSNKGFQEFRQEMKTLIQGLPNEPLSGKLQQYYRNNAYDTFAKVDRLNQDLYAHDLGMRYFIWSGGIIPTTRPICLLCNGKIIDSIEWNKVTFEDLKLKYQPGMDENSVPKDDLGGYGCRHKKDYILDSVARLSGSRMLDIRVLIK